MIGLVLAALLSLQQIPDVWVGIGFEAVENGLRVISLPYGSPAEKAGVMIDDVIAGMDYATFRESVSQRTPGDEMTFPVMRNGELLEIKVLVGERPVGIGDVKEYSPFSFPHVRWPEEQLATALIDEFKIAETHQDLRQRLGRLSDRGDQFRLSRTAYIQDNPFQLRTIGGRTIDNLAAAMNERNPSAALRLAAEWLDAEVEPPAPLKRGLTLEQHLDQLVALFQSVSAKQEEAFAKLTPEERKYIEVNSNEVFNAFSQGFDLQGIRDNSLRQRITRVLELATRIDFVKMFEGAALYWGVAQDGYLDDLESAAAKGWEAAGKPEGIFINRESPIGRVVVGGNGTGAYTEDAAILIDLAGKDFYANNSGSPRLGRIPVALLIDFAGDDAYEATVFWTQGSARMGHGLLVDRKGNDEYVGFDWTQGAAVLGVALFLD